MFLRKDNNITKYFQVLGFFYNSTPGIIMYQDINDFERIVHKKTNWESLIKHKKVKVAVEMKGKHSLQLPKT